MRHRVNLLDTLIDKTDVDRAVAQIDAFVESGVPHQIVTANVDFLRIAREDARFRDLINSSDLVVPDGMPLLWSSRLLGDPLPERVTGVELIAECARLSAAKGHRIFLLGAASGVAEAAATALRQRYPGAQIVATYAPPMYAVTAAEEEKIVSLVREMQPDILFVAFGAPKQDLWIRKNMHRLGVPVCMGVGGAFDFLAGRVRRAPRWMQNRGLEWLYRVIQEPTRLWKRYFVDDLPIFFSLMAQAKRGAPATYLVPDYAAVLEGHEPRLPALISETGVESGPGAHIA